MRLGRDCSKAGELVEKGERPCEENEDVFVPIKYDMVGCEAAKPGRGSEGSRKKKRHIISLALPWKHRVCVCFLSTVVLFIWEVTWVAAKNFFPCACLGEACECPWK